MKVFALDIATKTGWACGDGTHKGTDFGTLDMSECKGDYGYMAHAFKNWVSDMLHTYEPDIMSIEKTIVRRSASSYHLAGLSMIAHACGYVHEVRRKEYSPTTIKKFMTGNGFADKKQMVSAAKLRRFKVKDDNQADAIGLLLLTLDQLKGD